MDFVDVGQHAKGFIAIGQEAQGIIAIGQVATGVIAIGQLARGCFALGQLGFGFIGWGQLGLGILHAAGMVGAGGKRGIGGIIPLVPSLGRRRVPPQTTTLAAVHASGSGWIEADLAEDATGLGLWQSGQRLPVKIDARLQAGARALLGAGPRRVWAFTRRFGEVLACERIVHDPPRPYTKKSWWWLGGFQVAALFVVGAAWWAAVGNDLMRIVAEVADPSPSRPPAAAPKRPPMR